MKRLAVLIPVKLARSLADQVSDAGIAAIDTSEAEEAGKVWLSVYCEDADVEVLLARCQPIATALARRLGVSPLPQFEVRDVPDDWQTRWTLSLEPARLVPNLVLIAEGVDYRAEPGERVLRLEAGLFFGFGEHATTQMMSRWLADHCEGKTVVDVGCGTGVLSFVAAHVGASRVFGVDIDRPSVESAQRNAAYNGFGELCTFSTEPIQGVERSFDLVVANIDAGTLCLLASALVGVLAPGGGLALTGVLEEQAQSVQDAFEALGLGLEVAEEREGWVLLASHAHWHH